MPSQILRNEPASDCGSSQLALHDITFVGPGNHSVLWGKMLARGVPSIAKLGILLTVIAGWSCSRPIQGAPSELGSRSKPATSLRILITGDVAGSIEPCGCVKDQLGGLDRFATAVSNSKRARATLLVEVGALFFPRTPVAATERDELLMRAQTLAEVMRKLGLRAWVSGYADLALGESTLNELATQSGAAMLHASTIANRNESQRSRYLLTDIAGIRVGLFGLDSQSTSGASRSDDLTASLQLAARELQARGAKLKIAALNVPAEDVASALRRITEFQLVIIGGSSEHGLGADSDGSQPRQIGPALIVEPPNHLRGLLVLDFNVIEGKFVFHDASGIGRESEKIQLAQRMQDLSERVQVWKRQSRDRASIAAREADLKRLRARYEELSKPLAPPKASYFTLQSLTIGENMPGDSDVNRNLDNLGRRINSSNREKFSAKKALPAIAGKPNFVGVGSCETCHKEATAFWRTTRHGHAYQTLVDKERQFTLECVGCHVTGYELPGGSNVTDVDTLKDVQCETCHGPGSVHAKTTSLDSIARAPDRQLCASQCHHSPHVAPTWNVDDAWPKIVGKGHGDSAPR